MQKKNLGFFVSEQQSNHLNLGERNEFKQSSHDVQAQLQANAKPIVRAIEDYINSKCSNDGEEQHRKMREGIMNELDSLRTVLLSRELMAATIEQVISNLSFTESTHLITPSPILHLKEISSTDIAGWLAEAEKYKFRP